MPARWYYRHDGAEFGPVALPQLAQLASSGQIQLNDWVREGESSPWQPLAKSPEVLAAVTAAPTAVPHRPAPDFRAAKPAAPAPLRASAVPTAAAPRPRAKPAPLPPPAPVVARVATVSAPVAPRVSPASQRRHKKRSSSAPLAMILFGIGGAVVLGGVALLASLSGGDADSADVAATSPVATAPTAPEESLTTVRRNMAASIDNWRDIKVKGGLKQLIGFEVATVEWMPTASPADKPRLAVTLSITNTSDAPLSYASWDSPGRNGAYLVDSDLQMVAAASGQRGNIDLQADETIAETLHFALTKQDYTELRLVLPYGAVKRTGQWGYILSRESLQGEPSIFTPAATSAAAEPVPQAPATVAAPLPEAAPQPIVIKPVSEPTVDDGEATEDIRDIVRKSTPTPASAAKE